MTEVDRHVLEEEFRSWVLKRRIEGYTITETKHGARIECSRAIGYVAVYDLDDLSVVELRIVSPEDDEPIFFLHFELEDLARAKTLFYEMEETLIEIVNRKVRHVLLCCTCGITTTFFADKLNKTAHSLGVDYDFCAMPLEEARKDGADYAVVLLAPQVAHRLAEVQAELPDTTVIELPGQIFGAYDAAAALRLVVDTVAVEEDDSVSDTLRNSRVRNTERTVLSICYLEREQRESLLTYRMFDQGKVTLSGQVIRSHLGFKAILDLVATIRESGWETTDIDAIGISVPWRVDRGTIHFDRAEDRIEDLPDRNLSTYLTELWGTPVFVHNLGLSTASGLYLTQSKYENVAFHAQALGDPYCVEGFVLDGMPHTGAHGMAGMAALTLGGIELSLGAKVSAWHYDGVHELVTRYLAGVICTIAPDIIYVWCDLMPDGEYLRTSLAAALPPDAIPEIVALDEYDGYALVGDMALCLMALSDLEGIAE